MLLDALGTLLALVPPAPAFAQGLRREHGIELDEHEARKAFDAEIAYYRAHHVEARDEAALAALRRRCAAVLHDALPTRVRAALDVEQTLAAMLAALRFEAYPDALRVLPALRARRLRLVVLSNWDASLPGVLAAVGLAASLDAVVSSADVGFAKPAPEIFRAALDRAGVPAERALHVGDSLAADVHGALAAGVRAVLLRRPTGGVLASGERGADLGLGPGGLGDTGLDAVLSAEGDADLPAGVPVISSLAALPALL